MTEAESTSCQLLFKDSVEKLKKQKTDFFEFIVIHLDNTERLKNILCLNYSDLLLLFKSKSSLINLENLKLIFRECKGAVHLTVKFFMPSVFTFAPVLYHLMEKEIIDKNLTRAFYSLKLESALFDYIKTIETYQQEKTIKLIFKPISPFNHFFSDSTKEELKKISTPNN